MALPANDTLIDVVTESITAYSVHWTLAMGAVNTTVNGAVGNSANAIAIAFWNADAFPNDQYAQLVINTVSVVRNNTGPAVRCSAGGNGYTFRVESGGAGSAWLLTKVVGGVNNLLLSGIGNFGIGDTLELFARGSMISAYQNNLLVVSTSDPSLTVGAAGIAAFDIAGPSVTTWQGGAAPSVTAVLPRRVFVMP